MPFQNINSKDFKKMLKKMMEDRTVPFPLFRFCGFLVLSVFFRFDPKAPNISRFYGILKII